LSPPSRGDGRLRHHWSSIVDVRARECGTARTGEPRSTDTGAMEHLFHIARQREWEQAILEGEYRRSTRDRSLDDEGFIHCSTREQVAPTAERFYADEVQPLVVLTIDADRLTAEVRHEDLYGSGELFPHVYGPIPITAVVRVERFERDAAGRFPAPALDADA
jgi:glutathione S-transferase